MEGKCGHAQENGGNCCTRCDQYACPEVPTPGIPCPPCPEDCLGDTRRDTPPTVYSAIFAPDPRDAEIARLQARIAATDAYLTECLAYGRQHNKPYQTMIVIALEKLREGK